MNVAKATINFRLTDERWVQIGKSTIVNAQMFYKKIISLSLTYFKPLLQFYHPWKRWETKGFLTFSGGIELEQLNVLKLFLFWPLKQQSKIMRW